jgi:hypothetical protein
MVNRPRRKLGFEFLGIMNTYSNNIQETLRESCLERESIRIETKSEAPGQPTNASQGRPNYIFLLHFSQMVSSAPARQIGK